ncbi:MAG TPA: hypothetical protein VMZ28_08485 [Kofleriaceae bacterium]|nr:hypothetical protein [Kofleriaceae bacterium]
MRASILLCVALAACGGGDDDGGGGGGGGGGGEPTVVLTESVGPEGGTFEGDGVQLEVPESALADTLELTVTAEYTSVSGYTRYSPVFTFEPRGTEFDAPVGVAIEASEPDGIFYWTAAGSDTYEVMEGAVAEGAWLAASVDHLGRGFVGIPGETGGSCGDGPACTGGEICMEGVCTPYDPP